MPKLMDDMQINKVHGAGNFQFSAVKPEKLGATEYTLVTIVVDVTGSVSYFADALLDTTKSIIEACKLNSRSENIMVRFVTFNTSIMEIHGFKPVNDIDVNNYESFRPSGLTALFDAVYSTIGATITYGETLTKQDFDVNGAIYIITDGADNASTMTEKQIAEQINAITIKEDQLESMISVLVGLNDPNVGGNSYAKDVKKYLENFVTNANMTEFIDVGDATPKKLAKLGNFVSQSISSQSQSLGTGMASQKLGF